MQTRTRGRQLIESALVRRRPPSIQPTRRGQEHGPRTDGEDMCRTIDQGPDLPEQIGIVDQRPHAVTAGDEEGVESVVVVEGVG